MVRCGEPGWLSQVFPHLPQDCSYGMGRLAVEWAAALRGGLTMGSTERAGKAGIARVDGTGIGRRELILHIAAEIEAGAYATPRKLEIAVDRLIHRHFPQTLAPQSHGRETGHGLAEAVPESVTVP